MSQLSLPLELQRRVQLWSYDVSHSVLLLRANRQPGMATRVDLMFRAVRRISLRHRYDEVEISVVGPGEAQRLFGLEDYRVDGHVVFGVASRGLLDSYVVAGSLYIVEDDLDYGDSSVFDDDSLSAHVLRSGAYPD